MWDWENIKIEHEISLIHFSRGKTYQISLDIKRIIHGGISMMVLELVRDVTAFIGAYMSDAILFFL